MAGPIAEAFLKPDWKECQDVACPKPAIFVASRQFNERENGNLRSPLLLVFLNETVLETNLCVPVAEMGRPFRGAVERSPSVYSELAIWD
jgi:hypothetical protein